MIFSFFSAWSMFIPILSLISLALSYSVFVISFFFCSKIIFCNILSLLLLLILWINIKVEYLILSFAGQGENFMTSFVIFLLFASHFLMFSPTFQTHAVLLVRDMSQRVWFLPLSLLALHSFMMIFHLSLLLFYLLCFQFLSCALLDYFFCLALFLSNCMYLLHQCFLPLPLHLFVLFSLFQLLFSNILSFSIHFQSTSFSISKYHFSLIFRTSFNINIKKDFRHKYFPF